MIVICNDCEVLHERLQKLNGEMFGLKRTITNLRAEVRYERRQYNKLLKEKKEKNHFRKGQKRSKYGRN